MLRASPLCTCCRHYPGTATGALHCSIIQSFQPSPKWLSGRPVQRPFRGLLSVHPRYGLHTRAVTEFCDTLHRRLQPFRCLHSCSGCFRLERLPGGTFTHWESAAFSRRTPIADSQDITKLRIADPQRPLHLRGAASRRRVKVKTRWVGVTILSPTHLAVNFYYKSLIMGTALGPL